MFKGQVEPEPRKKSQKGELERVEGQEQINVVEVPY